MHLPTVHAAATSALAVAAGLSATATGVTTSAAPKLLSVLAAPDGFKVGSAAVSVPYDAAVGASEASVQYDTEVRTTAVPISYDAAVNSISAATSRVRSELELIHAQLREQGQGWYRLSLASAMVGFGIIALAVVALVLGNVTTGLVTTASSIVPNAIASLFFVQARRANRRLDEVMQELSKSHEAYALLEIANTIPRIINDSRLRNEIVVEIIRKVIAK